MYWIRMLKNVIDGPFYTALASGDVGCCGVGRALSWFTSASLPMARGATSKLRPMGGSGTAHSGNHGSDGGR